MGRHAIYQRLDRVDANGPFDFQFGGHTVNYMTGGCKIWAYILQIDLGYRNDLYVNRT